MVLKFIKRRLNNRDARSAEPFLAPGLKNLINSFLGGSGIPPMPSGARAAFELSLNPEAEAADFVALLETDEALASRVIKIANSVYYDRGNASRSIEESVLAIGLTELRALLQTTSLSQVFPSPSPTRAFLWSHDIATALCGRVLATELNSNVIDTIFLSGLMHDLGKLLMVHRFPEKYERIMDLVRREGVPFSDAEEIEFPFSHTDAGVLIAEQWRFAPEMIAAIRDHHLPWEHELSQASTTRIVKAADICAHALGCGHPTGFQRVRTTAQGQLAEMWSVLRIPAARGEQILVHTQEVISQEGALYYAPR